jgi:hypothetical protein
LQTPFARWRKASLTFGKPSEKQGRGFPEERAGFFDKQVRMNKFDKNVLRLEKNYYFCSPNFSQKRAGNEVNNALLSI